MNITALLENISAKLHDAAPRVEQGPGSHKRPRFTFASWRDSVLFEAPVHHGNAAVGSAHQTEPRVIDRYRVYGEIAFGGMAAVHLGLIEGAAGFRRPVAIKRLLTELPKSHEFTIGLQHEALLGAHIRHPNVVPILDLVDHEGELYLVMEYVLGETLARLLKQDGTLPIPIAVAIMGGVLRGLHAAHTTTSIEGEPLWVVHRDVSPQNILVGVDGLPRILDFGVAKSVPVETTRSTMVKGKIGYIAPEQILGETVDARTDIFAAGVVLWEALTGQRLFERQDPTEVILRLLTHGFPHISEYNPNIPQELDELVARALKRAPEERFQTAEEFAEALEALVQPASPSQVAAHLERSAWASLQKQRLLLTSIQAHGEYLRQTLPTPTVESLAAVTSSLTDDDDEMDGPTLFVTPGTLRRRRFQVWKSQVLSLGAKKLAMYGGTALVVLVSSMLIVWGLTASDKARAEEAAPTNPAVAAQNQEAPLVQPVMTNVAPVLVIGEAPADDSANSVPAATNEVNQTAPAATEQEVMPQTPSETAEESAAQPAQPKPRVRAAQRPQAARTTTTTTTKTADSRPAQKPCNPPFFVDGSGIKRLKPQCF
jgi:serine/threonine-protein kinase